MSYQTMITGVKGVLMFVSCTPYWRMRYLQIPDSEGFSFHVQLPSYTG